MKQNTKFIIALIILVVAGTFAYYYSGEETTEVPIVQEQDSVIGCYVATLGKDVYSMKIADQEGEKVSGTLVFDNFEKDSSHGNFSGTYKDGILLADYSFNSEGMDSVMEVIFKRMGNDFVRGYGPVDETGTGFTDLTQIQYDNNAVFKSSPSCVTTLE